MVTLAEAASTCAYERERTYFVNKEEEEEAERGTFVVFSCVWNVVVDKEIEKSLDQDQIDFPKAGVSQSRRTGSRERESLRLAPCAKSVRSATIIQSSSACTVLPLLHFLRHLYHL